MKPRAHRPTAAVAARVGVLLAAGLAAGCTTSDAVPPDASSPPAGPAEAYVELVLGIGAQDAAAQALAFEEAVAACMEAEGFDYLPDVGSIIMPSEDDAPRGSRAFAETYGYGTPATGELFEGVPDGGNEAIRAVLSSEALAEYEATLFGDPEDTGDGADGSGTGVGGCLGVAQREVFLSGAREDAVYLALDAEITRIEQQVLPADPAVVELDAAWSACMADAGYPGLRRPEDAEAAAWASFTAWNDDMAAAGGAPEGDDGLLPGQAQVRIEEVALATADWVCRDAGGYGAAVAQVRDALQHEYVDVHRAELDAWVERFAER